MNISVDLLQQFIRFLINSFRANTSSGAIKSKTIPNQQLADELHEPIIKKFLKRNVYSSFKDNIWGAEMADIQLISK